MGNIYHNSVDTLSLTCTYTDNSSNPINISAFTIDSKVKAVDISTGWPEGGR